MPFRPREPVSLPTIKGLNRPRTLIEVRAVAASDVAAAWFARSAGMPTARSSEAQPAVTAPAARSAPTARACWRRRPADRSPGSSTSAGSALPRQIAKGESERRAEFDPWPFCGTSFFAMLISSFRSRGRDAHSGASLRRLTAEGVSLGGVVDAALFAVVVALLSNSGFGSGGSLNGDEGDVLALVVRLVVRDLSGAHVSPRCPRQRRGTPRSSREASTQSPTDLDFDASGGASQSSSSATSSTTSSSFSSIRSSRRCLAIRP